MNTSYDVIYSTFLNNCMVSDIDLPSSNKQIYEIIKNAVMLYNNYNRTDIICDNTKEEINRVLNDDELLILAHFIRLVFLKNQLTLFTLTWQPFDKDMGLKNYSTQLKSLERLVKDAKEDIINLRNNQEEDIF